MSRRLISVATLRAQTDPFAAHCADIDTLQLESLEDYKEYTHSAPPRPPGRLDAVHTFEFYGDGSAGDVDMLGLLQQLPPLRHLRLESCRYHQNTLAEGIALHAATLQAFFYEQEDSPPADTLNWAAFTSLRRLTLDTIRFSSTNGYRDLMPTLEQLVVWPHHKPDRLAECTRSEHDGRWLAPMAAAASE